MAGLLARRVAGPCEVTLRAPAPLGQPLAVRAAGEGSFELTEGDTVLARARPCSIDLAVPAPPDPAEAEKRAGSCRAFETHPFPRCFVCGPARPPGDGLRIFPGWFAERELAAAPWVPDASLAEPSGAVAAEFVWAALDSPSAFPLLEPASSSELEPLVLGRLAVDLRRPVLPGERLLVSAWSLGVGGRRGVAGAALHAEAGDLCAVARATWISLAQA